MLTIRLLLLALVCSAVVLPVVAEEEIRDAYANEIGEPIWVTDTHTYEEVKEGTASDNFKPNPYLDKQTHTTTTINTEKEKSYQLGKDEQLYSRVEEASASEPEIESHTDYTTEKLENGTMVKKTTTKTVRRSRSKIIKTVRKFWKDEGVIVSIQELIMDFAKYFGSDLSEDDYKLFNAIAYTDPVSAKIEYEYFQTSTENLRDSLRKATRLFSAVLTENDLIEMEEDIKKCKDGAYVKTLDTSGNEQNTAALWEIHAEVFMATCGGRVPAHQLFAYSASKQGIYQPKKYSEPNAATIDRVITNWLYKHIFNLFTCTNAQYKAPFSSTTQSTSRAL